MALNWVTKAVSSVLQNTPRLGLYSLPFWEQLSPFMKRVLFGDDAQFGKTTNTHINLKDIVLSATTTKDWESLEWRSLGFTRPETTVNGAVDNSTTVVLADARWFSVWDYIIFLDDSGDIKAYITAINGNTITIDKAQTIADWTPTIRVSYSKWQWNAIDRGDYELEYETFSNYFQDFGSKKTFTLDLLNSHIDVDLGKADLNKSPQELLKEEYVQESIQNYLDIEFARKIGLEVLWDVEMAFISGNKNKANIGGSVRRYTLWLDDISDTVTVSASDTNENKFSQISDTIYDVINQSWQYYNKNVVVLCNDAFYKQFMRLMQNNVNYTTDVETAGNVLHKIQFVDGRVIELSYMPAMNRRFKDKPVAFVVPTDLIGAKTKKFIDLESGSNGFTPIQNKVYDIKLQKNTSDADTLDTFSYSIYYPLSFIFGGAESGIYKKIVIA